METFAAIDFELATASYNSVCALGIVLVENGVIVEEFHSLVRPPDNKYMWQTSRVHGIKAKHTIDSPTFSLLYPEIKNLLFNRLIVAHNEQFDRAVLRSTMDFYGVIDKDLGLDNPWECTSKLYHSLGFSRTKLNLCCEIMGIPLDHHDPLSDARAAAQLYINRHLAKEKNEAFAEKK